MNLLLKNGFFLGSLPTVFHFNVHKKAVVLSSRVDIPWRRHIVTPQLGGLLKLQPR
ncbi:hypothetical protein BDW67DRAFT_158311 [Aspergillus spinulosporus]